ncbi:MAG: long-chain fatty acid--CoA ligase [Alphaproteobacteria bacterium]
MSRRANAKGRADRARGARRPASRRILSGLRGAAAFLRELYKGRRAREAPSGWTADVRPFPWEASYPDGVAWDLAVEPRPLFTLLDDAVAAYAEKPCLEFLGKKYDYREVGALVAKAAKGFRALGVEKGVRVGLFLPNCPYFVICYHAILKAGGVVVNFNPLYAEREVARQLRDSGARVVVTMNLKTLYHKIVGRLDDTEIESIVVCRMSAALPFPESALFRLFRRNEVADIPSDQQHVPFEKLVANDGAGEPADIDPEKDVAVLQYTGGTTGLPKGAMLTHAALYTNTVQTRHWAPQIKLGEERMLAVLPLFHVFGMTGIMNLGLYTGSQLILMPRFKVSEVLKAIHKQRPTVFLGVPTMYSAINARKDLDEYDLSSLEFCISGGAPLALDIKNTFERLTGCDLVEGYGLTEAGPVCTINPLGGSDRSGSIGLPVPGTVIEIVALDDPTRFVPLGERGEICVSGPQVMAGYWNREEETAATLFDGRLRTGDVGYIDADGFVYVVDRIKDLIISGGFNVYPRMVEEAIYLHPGVAEAAACGVPDRHRGEIVKAFVTLREGESLTAAQLRAYLRDKLAPFELPREIEFRDAIPKTLMGKPNRRELVAEELRRSKT